MKCGCKIEMKEGCYFPTGIIYCSLHEAAPEMLEACKKALAFVFDGQLVAHRSFGALLNRFDAADIIRAAIATAERS